MEFHLLNGDEARAIDPEGVAWPSDTVALFATEGAEIMARSAIIQLPVIEGSMVHPDLRGTSLAYRMLREIETILKAMGKTHAIAMAANDQPEVSGYLERVGYEKMPVTMYSKKLEAECQ